MAILMETTIREALAVAYLQGVLDSQTDILENNDRDYNDAAEKHADKRIAMLKGAMT